MKEVEDELLDNNVEEGALGMIFVMMPKILGVGEGVPDTLEKIGGKRSSLLR